jgi:hypothetical protein
MLNGYAVRPDKYEMLANTTRQNPHDWNGGEKLKN